MGRLETQGRWYRGNPITYSAGAVHAVDLRFLESAARALAAPVVKEIVFRVSGDVTSSGNGLTGADGHKLIRRIRMADNGGEFWNLPGSINRIVEQMEYGAAAVSEEATLGASTQDASYIFHQKCHFELPHGTKSRDFGVPLNRFLSGGQVQITTDVPYDATVTSATITPYFRIVDEKQRELKPRMVWRETAISAAEDRYRVGGLLRGLFVSSDTPTGASHTALSGANYDTVESQDLLLGGSFPTDILLQDYIRKAGDRYSAADEFVTQDAIPVVTPSRDQNLLDMQNTDAFHLKLEATITSGVVARCYIEPRNPEYSAEWLGMDSLAELENAIRENGRVGNRKAIEFGNMASMLPIRL